jgi:hypothetical protein
MQVSRDGICLPVSVGVSLGRDLFAGGSARFWRDIGGFRPTALDKMAYT